MLLKVRDEIIRNHMLYSGENVIAALSGGADSVCLLICLKKLSEELGITIYAAHLNHMLRGIDADKDEQFCKDLCEKLNIKLFVKKVDIKALANGRGLEETGRIERYKFFDEVSKELGSAKIATAHNKNDLAETMLMRMARGCSVKGAAGIRQQNRNIIRPLLYIDRKEIEDYLKAEGQGFVTDKTNLSDDYTRNKLRHKVLPVLQEINPEYLNAFSKLSLNLYRTVSYIEDEINSKYGKITDEIDIEKFTTLPDVLKSRIVEECAYRAGAIDISAKQIKDINMLCIRQSGKRIELPGKIEAIREYKKIIFTKKLEKADYNVKLFMGENVLCEAGYIITIRESNKGIDKDKLTLPLYARPKKEGDTIEVVGMDGTKKLKRLYADEKLSFKERNNYPVIMSGDCVAFALGRCSRKYVSDKNTKNAISIEIKEMGGGIDDRRFTKDTDI
ncbi:MAG: tRNA lysidine(34) synthetase TilS [Bacillota bacterium]|nr:tRNA lysidine(34) synthetase TilS [Bacillota bacterium]